MVLSPLQYSEALEILDMDDKLVQIVQEDPRYTYESYEFICDAVEYTQSMLSRLPDENDDPERDYQITGEELLRGACALAVDEFGLLASVVFKRWGIQRTDDIGEIVFKLFEAEKLAQSDYDDIDDYRNVFDLEKTLLEGFLISAGSTWTGEMLS